MKEERSIQENPVYLGYRLWQTQIESLGLPSWKCAIQAKMFDALFYHSNPLSNTDHLNDVKVLLTKYHRMERISLVELAVWKAVCIGTCGTNQGHLEWAQWTRHGWKRAKNETRQSNEIAVVIAALLPFVESPTTIDVLASPTETGMAPAAGLLMESDSTNTGMVVASQDTSRDASHDASMAGQKNGRPVAAVALE
jgi:hypothetical protein